MSCTCTLIRWKMYYIYFLSLYSFGYLLFAWCFVTSKWTHPPIVHLSNSSGHQPLTKLLLNTLYLRDLMCVSKKKQQVVETLCLCALRNRANVCLLGFCIRIWSIANWLWTCHAGCWGGSLLPCFSPPPETPHPTPPRKGNYWFTGDSSETPSCIHQCWYAKVFWQNAVVCSWLWQHNSIKHHSSHQHFPQSLTTSVIVVILLHKWMYFIHFCLTEQKQGAAV